jgi:hypothetical protein
MPPSSPPRHPREEENPEPYSLIIIVSSGKIQLQHKASCYRGHGYSNRLIFPAGVHLCYATRTDLQGGGNLVRERSTEAIRHFIAHLSNSTERPSAGLNPKYSGPWTPTLTYSCTVRGWPGSRNKNNTARAKEDTALPGNQPAVLLTSEESSDDTTKQRSP